MTNSNTEIAPTVEITRFAADDADPVMNITLDELPRAVRSDPTNPVIWRVQVPDHIFSLTIGGPRRELATVNHFAGDGSQQAGVSDHQTAIDAFLDLVSTWRGAR